MVPQNASGGSVSISSPLRRPWGEKKPARLFRRPLAAHHVTCLSEASIVVEHGLYVFSGPAILVAATKICLLRVPIWRLSLQVAAQDAELGSALRPRIPSPPIASASVHSSPTLSIDSSSIAIFAVPWRTIQKQAVAAWQPLPVEVADERRTNPPPGRSSRPISDQGVWGYRPRSPQTPSSRTHLRPSLPSVACPYWTRSGLVRSPQVLPG